MMDKVTVICYGKREVWDNRMDAIRFYKKGVIICDGCEKARYANILAELVSGYDVCSDGHPERRAMA